jgi:DNA repair exonuclease SbcCD nuclease subunit
MKIMHLADFHLDSAFSGFSKEKADEKRAELRECFVRAMQIAKNREVKLVLIPGDLFDTPFCSSQTRRVVFDAIATAGCPVVIAPGNHDFYNKNGTYADKALPENAFVFTSSEIGRFDFDELGISVIGYAFESDRYEENPLSADVPISKENINILCAHTEIGVPLSRYAPMSVSSISKHGFTYAALGHVHNPENPIQTGDTLIAYSGFAQGRSFDELGEGGAYIVDIDLTTKKATLERVKLSSMSYEIERVDVTSLSNDNDVALKIESVIKAKDYGNYTALRVILTGAIPSDYALNVNLIKEMLSANDLALLQIENETVSNFDLAQLEKDITIRGEIYRSLLPLLNSDNEKERQKASLALKFALSALDKREFGID